LLPRLAGDFSAGSAAWGFFSVACARTVPSCFSRLLFVPGHESWRFDPLCWPALSAAEQFRAARKYACPSATVPLEMRPRRAEPAPSSPNQAKSRSDQGMGYPPRLTWPALAISDFARAISHTSPDLCGTPGRLLRLPPWAIRWRGPGLRETRRRKGRIPPDLQNENWATIRMRAAKAAVLRPRSVAMLRG
jgi:hypothetical protein